MTALQLSATRPAAATSRAPCAPPRVCQCGPAARPSHRPLRQWALTRSSRLRPTRASQGDLEPSESTSDELGRPGGGQLSVGLKEDEWRRRVRETVARELAEEAKGGGPAAGEQAAGEAAAGGEATTTALQANEDSSFSSVSGGTLVLSVSLALSLMTNATGLDVFGNLHVPAHPVEFTSTCLSWTAAAVLLTVITWDRIFFRSDSEAAQIFQREAMEAQSSMEVETKASMATAAVLFALAEGIVFRGAGLAVATDLLTGLNQLPGAVDLLANTPWEQEASFTLLPAYHLPLACMWPFVCLGAASFEAWVETLAHGGMKRIDRKYIAELLGKSLQTQTSEVQLAVMDDDGQMVLKKGRKVVATSKISVDGLERAGQHFLAQLDNQRLRQKHMHAGPALVLARAFFLSAEVVLTNNLLSTLITGAACEAVQSVQAMTYMEQQLSKQGGPSPSSAAVAKPILVRDRQTEES